MKQKVDRKLLPKWHFCSKCGHKVRSCEHEDDIQHIRYRPDLEVECGYCHLTQVVLVWKQYLKQYRGMCPNETCEVWSVVTEKTKEDKGEA